jgi:hypothetical protein
MRDRMSGSGSSIRSMGVRMGDMGDRVSEIRPSIRLAFARLCDSGSSLAVVDARIA